MGAPRPPNQTPVFSPDKALASGGRRKTIAIFLGLFSGSCLLEENPAIWRSGYRTLFDPSEFQDAASVHRYHSMGCPLKSRDVIKPEFIFFDPLEADIPRSCFLILHSFIT